MTWFAPGEGLGWLDGRTQAAARPRTVVAAMTEGRLIDTRDGEQVTSEEEGVTSPVRGERKVAEAPWVRIRRISGLTLILLTPHALPLAAQAWNDSATVALVERGIAARRRAEPDSSLTSYSTRAHGFVFFLAQAGQNLQGPPRLIKADELDVEVYWHAPSSSKQVIVGWRDGRWLPTDISYHRDHLGIVTNNFGDLIRIGEGNEVRDVVHPLAAEGTSLYDYRLRDSVRVRSRDTVLELYEVEVRPKEPTAPRVIGTLSLDVASGDLVRFRFSFTPSSYLDHSLEDISIVLENARLEGRWWLPWRQEVEIRRRATWLDFPVRSIIRGRWEIGDYELNVAVPGRVLAGPVIGGLRAPVDTGGAWTMPLAQAIQGIARPVERSDLDAVRQEIERLAEGRTLSGLPRTRLGISSFSDLAHVNRVQGLALGVGMAFEVSPRVVVRPRGSFGTSDERLLGDLRVSREMQRGTFSISGGRRVLDVADHPIVSGVVNSLLAQEGGRDYGDYVLLDQASVSLVRRLGALTSVSLGAAVEHSRSVTTEATPASGRYRPNPPLGAGTIGVGRLGFEYQRASLEQHNELNASLAIEGGNGDRDYVRTAARVGWSFAAGPGDLALRAEGGAGTRQLPGYRSFTFGGWGTLLGEPFRAFGGRRSALASVEYRLAVPFPAIPLGAFASTGRTITLAPFLAAGWAGGAITGLPWRPSGEIRPVAGVALEWFHHLLRVEAGVSLRTGRIGVSADLNREWWDIL